MCHLSLPLLVVGLCGRARHGKDVVAAVMAKQFRSHGMRCFPCSVSMVIHEAAVLDGAIKSAKRSECSPEEIQALVRFGNAGREQDENFWVDRLLEKILAQKTDVALITGIRFPNEGKWVGTLNGVLARIRRLNSDGSEFISRDRDPNDITETAHYHLLANYELVAMTGQDEWLRSQAQNLTSHLLRRIDGGQE